MQANRHVTCNLKRKILQFECPIPAQRQFNSRNRQFREKDRLLKAKNGHVCKMTTFIQQLRERNETMYYFGLICLIAAIVFLILSKVSNVQVNNVSAWIKPFKFSFSTFLFAWAMLWYCSYLPDFNVPIFNWSIIILLGFEIVYIALQAYRGQLSHFNVTTPFYSAMYSMMAMAATVVTIYTAYVAYLFFKNDF